MKPVVAIVGRPNVGKSTLFNRLTRTRAALVADFPGLTRDRHYGEGRIGPRDYIAIDTGGFEPVNAEGIVREMAAQTEQAIAECDVVIFVLDAREGLTGQDQRIAKRLRVAGAADRAGGQQGRRAHRTVRCRVSRAGAGRAVVDFRRARRRRRSVDADRPRRICRKPGRQETEEPGADKRIRVAVVGRPNVGKSTLINALLGEQRLIAFDQPGTTRDSIEIEFDYDGQAFTLIDTAGLRRRGKVFETIEKFSVVKTLQSIADSNVVILLLDASSEIADQDAHIAGFVLESGRAMVVAVNKWDGLDAYQRERITREIERKLHFLRWARFHQVSARKRTGLKPMMRSVTEAYRAAFARLPTPKLTRALIAAVERQQPARAGHSRPKPRYAHQGGHNPPVIVVHGNSLNQVADSYRRYLEGQFREQFELTGTPLRVEFRTSKNPYVE